MFHDSISFADAIDGDVDFPMSVSTEPMTLNCETAESVEVNVITDVTVVTPVHLRVSWLLYEVCITASLSLSLLYWLLIYDGQFTDTKFNNNCLISILLLVDVFITKVPVRLLHGIFPVLLCLVYFLFNFAYCRLGGDAVLFPVSHQRIYAVLQWDKPLFPTIAGVIITFLLFPSIHMFWFSMYQFRVYLWKRYGQDDSWCDCILYVNYFFSWQFYVSLYDSVIYFQIITSTSKNTLHTHTV